MEGFVPWPSEYAERYRRRGYWCGETLGELLRPWAQVEPDRIALVAGNRRLTYGQLNTRADRLAAGLSRLGIRSGERVLVQLPNTPDFVHLTVALFRIGAVPVFALPSHRSSEIIHLCNYSGAVAYVIPDTHQGFDYTQLAEEVRTHAPNLEHVFVAGRPGPFRSVDDVDSNPVPLAGPRPSDPAFFLLSGGTVGLPKLIPRTHDDYAYQLRATAQGLGVDRNSVYLAALPVAHNAALGCPGLLGMLRAGGKVVLGTSPSPSDLFPLIEREGVTLTTLITPLVMLWIEAAEMFDARFPSLLLQLGGAPLDPGAGRKVFRVLGSSLTHWFGMAEGLLCFTRLGDPEDVVIHTQGRPLSADDELRVVDDNENDVARGQTGQLLTRGPCTLRGYFNAEEHNRLAFTPEGYLRTGDLVRITEEGNLLVEGRIKNVINRGGEKIWVEELESQLLAHLNVAKVAVIGAPDAVMGERICAFIVPRMSTVTLPEIKRFLAERGVADYKAPDRLEIVPALPETGVGKINRLALRRMLTDPATRN